MNFNKYFIYAYTFSFSLFWISLIFYFRFFHERKTYTLSEWKSEVNYLSIIFATAICVFHLFIILFLVYNLLFSSSKKKSSFILKKMISYSNQLKITLFYKPLEHLRDMIAPHIPYSGIFFCNFTKFFKNKSNILLKLIVLLFNNLPRIVVALILFIEVIFYNQIFYFIPSLLLLFIPLCWNVILDLYINFAERALRDISKNIQVIPLGNPSPNGWHLKYKFNPWPHFSYEENEIKEYEELWFLSMTMLSFGHGSMKTFQSLIMPYMTILTSSFYLFASIFKLIYILF